VPVGATDQSSGKEDIEASWHTASTRKPSAVLTPQWDIASGWINDVDGQACRRKRRHDADQPSSFDIRIYENVRRDCLAAGGKYCPVDCHGTVGNQAWRNPDANFAGSIGERPARRSTGEKDLLDIAGPRDSVAGGLGAVGVPKQ
jgi:hypothetical protein